MERMQVSFSVSPIMHIFLKAYLSLRGKIFKLYTFSCSPATSLAIKIKEKKKNYLCACNNFFSSIYLF